MKLTDAVLETLARQKMCDFHIDVSKYDLARIERDTITDAVVILNGTSGKVSFPQVSVLFTDAANGWDTRIELSFGTRSIVNGVVFLTEGH
ncbi:hypothetical protein PQR66_39525 [Paraburkholderia agricolaris]|uniref:Uncharacterized protein n=1 Tax=Paraburkholderia agricolaris TaxID=2152888 RepID=A0ABW9A2B0_9BURK